MRSRDRPIGRDEPRDPAIGRGGPPEPSALQVALEAFERDRAEHVTAGPADADEQRRTEDKLGLPPPEGVIPFHREGGRVHVPDLRGAEPDSAPVCALDGSRTYPSLAALLETLVPADAAGDPPGHA